MVYGGSIARGRNAPGVVGECPDFSKCYIFIYNWLAVPKVRKSGPFFVVVVFDMLYSSCFVFS